MDLVIIRFFARIAARAWTLALPAILFACTAPTGSNEFGVATAALCSGVRLTPSTLGVFSGTVTLAASGATCGSGETSEYRFLYQRQNAGALLELRGWSTTPTVAWNTTGLPSGRYTVLVYARAVGTTVAKDSAASITPLVGTVCSGATLVAAPASPTPPLASVSLTAGATCELGATPEFRFRVREGTAPLLTELRGWGTSPTVVWDTSAITPGIYTLYVDVRAAGNLSTSEAQRAIPYRIGEVCTLGTFAANPQTVTSPGTPVGLTATATCTGSASPRFRFVVQPYGSAFSVLSDWGTSSSATWNTTGLASTGYTLRVEVRADDYAGTAQGAKALPYTLGGLCAPVVLTPTPRSPQTPGVAIGLTAAATCTPGATAEYRFLYTNPLGVVGEIQGWGGPTASLATAGLPPGRYTLTVQARSTDSSLPVQAQSNATYFLGAVCNSLMFAVTPSTPQPEGTPRTLTAAAMCLSGGAPEYQFSYRRTTVSTWTVARSWATSGTHTWGAGIPGGDYVVRAEARGVGHPGPAEATSTVTVTYVPDADGDGHSLADGDCDDTNPAIHPGADDLCNGIDDDCDGATDEPAFANAIAYTTAPPGELPYALSVATGDLDDDGDLDLAVANYYRNTIAVLLNDGAGAFSAPNVYAAGDRPHWIATGDFDDDGFDDVVVTRLEAAGGTVFLSNGDGTLTEGVSFSAISYGVSTGDVDADGTADIALFNGGQHNFFLPGVGDGTFDPLVLLPNSGGATLALVDLNADGLLDFANGWGEFSGGTWTNGLRVTLGTGGGAVGPTTTYPTTDWPGHVAAGDVDGDGDVDLATATNEGSREIFLWRNNGDGSFLEGNRYPSSTGFSSIAIADLNADGLGDVLATPGVLRMYVSLGGGNLAGAQTVGPGIFGESVIAEDLNGDGRPDAALASSVDGVNVLLNLGCGM